MSQELKNKSFFSELVSYIWLRKVWWLAPAIIVLVLVGVLVIFGQSSAVSPFIYMLF